MVTLTEGAVKWLIAKIKAASSGTKKFTNLQIPVSAWHEEETEDGYRYAASVSIPTCTAEDMPIVVFPDEDTDDFYATAESGNGIVTVYACAKPGEIITIKSIALV